MHFANYRVPYLAPQSEVIDFQIERNFMDSLDYSRSFSFKEGGLEEVTDEL